MEVVPMVLKMTVPHSSPFQLRTLLDLSQTSVQFESKIRIRKGETVVDPKFLAGMVALLDAGEHDLEISADGEDAYNAVQVLYKLATGSIV
jgi:phosphotransferase system HPr-like phosphotransfer protein